MAKRFIDNQIFKKGFMKVLPTELKLLYIYLFCECDHYGIWNIELDIAQLRIGANTEFNLETLLEKFGTQVVLIDSGTKLFLPQFITFQYGTLEQKSKMILGVKRELEKRNLIKFLKFENVTVPEQLNNTYESVKDKDKEQDMVKVKEKVKDKEKGENVKSHDLSHENDVGHTNTRKTGQKFGKSSKNTQRKQKITVSESQIAEIPENSLFSTCMHIYAEFYKQFGRPLRIQAVDGKSMKEIIAYLNQVETVKSGDKTVDEIWQYILDKWNTLDNWQQSQTELRQINSRLPNIIEALKKKNGKGNTNSATSELANALRAKIEGK
jgi:hypothetical protein